LRDLSSLARALFVHTTTKMGNKHGHDDLGALNPDDLPSPDAEKEPMLLLDTTGSMNENTSAEDSTPRRDTIREAIGIIVSALAKQDSQVIRSV